MKPPPFVLSGCMFLATAASSSFAESWTESFETGVGRFTITVGEGDTMFVHDPNDEDLNCTFIRQPCADRRLANLGRSLTSDDSAGFVVEWSPVSGSLHAFPHIGFFDATTGAWVAFVSMTDNRYQLGVGTGPGVENTGTNWFFGETYRLYFFLDGVSHSVTFSTWVLEGNEFVLQGVGQWDVPAVFAFDAVGVGNLVEENPGPTLVADIDNFSFFACDIAQGVSIDLNGNGVPDECENELPVCSAGGPYVGECEIEIASFQLDGTASSDPDDDSLRYEWSTDCPGGVFDDSTSPTPILTVDTSGGCDNGCGVTLAVDDGNGGTSECSTSVTISDTQPPVVTCSATPVNGQRMLIEYDVSDDCGDVTGSAVIETACCPLPVTDGQIIAMRCKQRQECKIMLDFKRDMFRIQSDVATLVVTATDECGNEATCTVELCIPDADDVDDSDSDSDSDDDGDSGSDSDSVDD